MLYKFASSQLAWSASCNFHVLMISWILTFLGYTVPDLLKSVSSHEADLVPVLNSLSSTKGSEHRLKYVSEDLAYLQFLGTDPLEIFPV